MGALQKVPSGLLGALNLKTLGRAPTELSDAVVATVDALEMYLVTQQAVVDSNLTQVWSNGQTLALTVPQGTLWRVRSVGAEFFLQNATTIEADGITISLGVQLPLSAYIHVQHYPMAAGTVLNFASGGRFFTAGFMPGRPILLLPGQALFVEFDGDFVSAGATAARIRAAVEAIPL